MPYVHLNCCPAWAITLHKLSYLTFFKAKTGEKILNNVQPRSNLIEMKLCALPYGFDHIKENVGTSKTVLCSAL